MPILRASNGILKDHKFLPANNQQWKKDFFFVQAADTQLGYINLLGTIDKAGVPYPDTKWDRELDLCRLAVQKMNVMNPKPEFFIICGDLVDAYPQQFPKTRNDQIQDFKEVLSQLSPEIAVVCVCGNHDVGNTPTHQTISQYNTQFGDDYFYFWIQGVFFIVLNSQFYVDASEVPDLKKAHDSWLDAVLNLEERKCAKHTIIFQHIPWFLYQWDEPNISIDYQKLIHTKKMVELKSEGPTTNVLLNIEKKTRFEMLEKLDKAGVSKIFCGHTHHNCGGFYNNMEVVVTTALGIQLGEDDHGMRLVKVTENEIEHKYYKLEDFPKTV